MPYISNEDDRREALRNGEPALTAGELNYQIFYYVKHNRAVKYDCMYGQIKTYVDNFLGEKPNYQRYNDMTGVLIRCSKEIDRRYCKETNKIQDNIYEIILLMLNIMDSYDDEIAKYEDLKINQNGDVE